MEERPSAANDNNKLAPLRIRLAAMDAMECFWSIIYPPEDRKGLDARRDWRSIRRLRAEELALRDRH